VCSVRAVVLALLVQVVESGHERIEPLIDGWNYAPARGECRMHGVSVS
jgi:hypothetical protein